MLTKSTHNRLCLSFLLASCAPIHAQTRPVLPDKLSGVPSGIGYYQPFAGPFYTPIPAKPTLDPNSSTIITNMMKQLEPLHQQLAPLEAAAPPYVGKSFNIDYNSSVYYSQASDPLYTITCEYEYLTPPLTCGQKIHIPAFAVPEQSSAAPFARSASDHHLAIIDSTTGTEYDMWQADMPAARAAPLQSALRVLIRHTAKASGWWVQRTVDSPSLLESFRQVICSPTPTA